MAIKETIIDNGLTKRLGFEKGTRVRFTEKVESKEDLEDLGISRHYAFLGLVGTGRKARVFIASCQRHDFLETALREETGNPQSRTGQIDFSTRIFGNVMLHNPLSQGRKDRRSEISKIIAGVSPDFWEPEVFIVDGQKRTYFCIPRTGKIQRIR